MLCFGKFPVANNFMGEKGGEYQTFPSKIFCLKVPKKYVLEPFSVSLISGVEKFYASEGYVMIFCQKIFASQCRKMG